MLPVNTLPAKPFRQAAQMPNDVAPAVQLLCVRRPGLPRVGPRGVRARPRRQAQGDALAPRSRGAGIDRGARGARMEATPGDAVGAERSETRAIHAGQDPEALYGSVNVPIYQTSTYAQDEVGRPKRWDYGRGGNPTREAFQVALAALEGGSARVRVRERHGGRDHAAAHVAARRSRVLADDVYGGTYRLLANVLSGWGLAIIRPWTWRTRRRSGTAIRPTTKLVWVETPSNPMLKIVDLAAVAADRARSRRARRRRQHVRDAGAPATARAGRRRRRAQRDEVPRRPLRPDRRRDRHERPGVDRTARVPHERARARCPGRWTATWRSAA